MLSGQVSVTICSDGGEHCWYWDDEFASTASSQSVGRGPVSSCVTPTHQLLSPSADTRSKTLLFHSSRAVSGDVHTNQ